MLRKLLWRLLQQLQLSHPSMTVPRGSGTLHSVHSVLPKWKTKRHQHQ